MSRSMRRLVGAVLLAGSAATAAAAAGDTNPWASPEDNDIADDAAQAIVDYCSGATALDDVQIESARQALLSTLGGDNFMFDMMKTSDNMDDWVSELTGTILEPGWILPRAAPMIGAIFIGIVFCGCCWSTCPCCKCCRCCSRERKSLRIPKAVVFGCLAGCVISIIFGLVKTLEGFGKARDGIMTMSCTAARMLNATLFGEDDPFFIGMVPALDVVWTLTQQLDAGSPLLTDATAVLDSTGPIQDAVTLAVDTVDLMNGVLQLPANLHPQGSLGEDLLHTCQLCGNLAGPLASLSSGLRSGVGVALAAARTEVQQQLSGGDRADLQSQLRTSAEPLFMFKNTIRDTFATFIDPSVFGQLDQHLNTSIFAVVNVFCLLAALVIMSALISTSCWALRERAGESYARCPHRCSLCTMCFAVPCFIMPVLVIGGILGVVSIPLAGMCLTMDVMDGPTFRQILPALGQTMDENVEVMMASFVDECIAGKGGSNPNLMDMVTVPGNATGSTQSMRSQLLSTVKEPLDAAFGSIDTAMGGSSGALAESQPILDLVAMLRRTPVDAMIIADSDKVSGDSDVSPMLASDPLRVGLLTSARCDNFTDNSSGSDVVIPGISNFVDRLAALGPKLASSSCVQNVDCSGSAEPTACAAGNAYVDLKRTLVQASPRLYRCDVFETSAGQPCDPKDMARDGAGGWVNDCLLTQNGSAVTTSVKEVSCNLQEFTAYVQKYEQRLVKVLERLDEATSDTQAKIVGDLRGVVQTHIIDPVYHIVNGVTCGFMPGAFSGFLNGFCFQGVIGFRIMGASYVIFAVSVMFVALVMYVQWRLAVDNVNSECATQLAVVPDGN